MPYPCVFFGVDYMGVWSLLKEDPILVFSTLSESRLLSEDPKGVLTHVKKY